MDAYAELLGEELNTAGVHGLSSSLQHSGCTFPLHSRHKKVQQQAQACPRKPVSKDSH